MKCNNCAVSKRCKSCNARYMKNYRAGVRKKTVPQRERKDILNRMRDVPCTDCRNKFPSVCMDFDHLPEFVKDFGIMSNYKYRSWDIVLLEIAKCEIVCSNCHRVRTATRR